MNGATITIVLEVKLTMDAADDSADRVAGLASILSSRMRAMVDQRFSDMEKTDVVVLATTTVAR